LHGYEASQFGSPYIETGHILLGLLREDKNLTAHFLQPPQVESIRPQIEKLVAGNTPSSTSVDLPLSNECKRVLAHAAEEAERMDHRHIGTEHLWLGLLREKDSLGANLLKERGLEIEKLREEVSKPSQWAQGFWPSPGRYSASPTHLQMARNTVEIHGARWNADYIYDLVNKVREISWHWEQREWRPRDVVLHRVTRLLSFDTALAQSSKDFALVKHGWTKDHCIVCRWDLFQSKDAPDHSSGYTNGRDWLCTECYEKFIARNDFFSSNYPELT
jgi:hypothetical protein